MSKKYEERTAKWIEKFVIGENLCPFAKKPFQADKILYSVQETTKTEELLETLVTELLILNNTPASEVSTTVIIHPNVLTDFYDYNDFLTRANGILEKVDMVGIVQIASFHPNYQFAGTDIDDVENYTNRSPYPMLHLLREEEVEKILTNYPNPENIPSRNIAHLQDLGLEKVRAITEKV